MAGWKVLDQEPVTDLVAGGRFVDSMEITFETETGSVGKVKVPAAGYSEAVVRAAVQPVADAMVAVARIGQDGH